MKADLVHFEPETNKRRWWSIQQEGVKVLIQWGRLGLVGTEQTKTFWTTEQAFDWACDIRDKKIKKGYC